jgi:putative Mn2+ efflux pump MntP
MLKGVLYLHDGHEMKMTHPEAGFFLGIMTCMVNFACQFSNMIGALSAKTVPKVLSKFIAFKLLINV